MIYRARMGRRKSEFLLIVSQTRQLQPPFHHVKLHGYGEGKEGNKVMAKLFWAVTHNLEVSQNLATRYMLQILPFQYFQEPQSFTRAAVPRCCLNTERAVPVSLQSHNKNNRRKQEAIC